MSDNIHLLIDEPEEICMTLDGPPIPGKTGNGIASIVMNADYTLTINYTNGDSYTTPSIRGEEGNGIASIVVNPDYTMTITMDDGTEYVTPDMRGPQGDTGVGIASITKTLSSGNVDTYTILFTDGTSTTFTVTTGEDYVLTEQDKQDIAAMIQMNFHICSSGEYDPVTRIPTIVDPDPNIFYLVLPIYSWNGSTPTTHGKCLALLPSTCLTMCRRRIMLLRMMQVW